MSAREYRRAAVLTARRDAGAGLALITLTPPSEQALAYRAPGQYVEVHADEPGYFVLAGEVGASSWELLVRDVGGASSALATAAEGASFEISGPMGEGFPVDRADGRHLVVAVVGSALAAARSIVRARIARRASSETSVYIGVRTAADVALAVEVAAWIDAGVAVVLCLSRPNGDDARVLPGATHARGWVQDVLRSDVRGGRVTAALIFAMGPQAMLADVLALPPEAEKAGFSTTHLEVFTNV